MSQLQKHGWMNDNLIFRPFLGWNKVYDGSMGRNTSSKMGQSRETDRRSRTLPLASMPRFLFLLFLSLHLYSFSNQAFADIYTYHNPNGQLYFTDKKMDKSYKLLAVFRPKLTKKSMVHYNIEKYQQNKKKYQPNIQYAALKYHIDPKLLHAIIDTESAFNPQAYSKAGAVGLMQLMPQTAKELGVKDSWNPEQNIHGGARYFRQLLDTFNQNISLSLAAYNAGPNAVKRAGNNIPNYPETKRYVKKVTQLYHALKHSK